MDKNKILEKIKNKEVKMRPKFYFVLRTTLYILGIILTFLFAIFLASFIVFSLQISGASQFPALGLRGLIPFLVAFPWVLVIFALIFIIILQIFAKKFPVVYKKPKFSVVYKKPLLYSILGIIVFVLLVSFAIANTPFHRTLFRSAQEGKLPIMGPMYKGRFVDPSHNMCIGEVVEVADDGFQVETVKGESVGIIISSETYLPSDGKIEKGELIMIMGERKDSIINAFKVIKIKDNKEIYLLQRGGHIKGYMKMK